MLCFAIHVPPINTTLHTTVKMKVVSALFAAAGLAAMADAHGYFVTPTARKPGALFASICSEQAYYNMEGSINGNIQVKSRRSGG